MTFYRRLTSYRRRFILAVAAALYIVSIFYAPWVAKGSERVLKTVMEYGILKRHGPIFSAYDCAATEAGVVYQLRVGFCGTSRRVDIHRHHHDYCVALD